MSHKPLSSRQRLQEAAKRLFAERGYEATTAAAIVRLAKTSHSQFMAHFDDKRGILSAILLAISKTVAPLDKLKLVTDIFLSYLEREPTFRSLLLIERATTQINGKLQINPGFADFVKIFDDILAAMASRGELAADTAPPVLRSALVGALEGMLRDQLLRAQNGSAPYSESDIRHTFSNLISSTLQRNVVPSPRLLPPESGLQEQLEGSWVHHYLELAEVVLGPPGQA